MTRSPTPAGLLVPHALDRATSTAAAQATRRARALAGSLADGLDTCPSPHEDDQGPRSRRWWDQSLSKGAAGVTVLHAVRGRPDLVHRWLVQAVREDVSAAPGCGLWFGAPAVAFAVRAAGPHRYPAPAQQLDDALSVLIRRRLADAEARIDAAARPSRSEFDLVRGLSGLGALLLPAPGRNAPGDCDLLRDVLAYLVQLVEPVPAPDEAGQRVPGWWTAEIPSGLSRAVFAGGHADLGAAHGICGPLALLCLAALHDVRVPGQVQAIETICAWLDRWRQQHSSAGAWWPRRVTLPELRTEQLTEQTGPGRPSWCYGTPGLARAQQLAGLALGDTCRQDLAEQALLDSVTDPAQLAALTDLSVCHGWSGLLMTVWHAARDARHPGLDERMSGLLDELLAHPLVDDLLSDCAGGPDSPIGLVDGTAGVALTLQTITTEDLDAAEERNGWTRCLLMT